MATTADITDTITARIAGIHDELAALRAAHSALKALEPDRSEILDITPVPKATPRRRQTVTQQDVIALLNSTPDGLSARALAERAGASTAQLTTRLRELEQAGLVRSVGERRSRRWHPVAGDLGG